MCGVNDFYLKRGSAHTEVLKINWNIRVLLYMIIAKRVHEHPNMGK